MSVVTAIYKAPITHEFHSKIRNGYHLYIKYDGKKFAGRAYLSPEDKDFYSSRIGRNIALSRARMNAMNYEIKKSRKEMEYRYDFYQEATKYGKVSPAEVDPTGSFYRAIVRYTSRISALKKALEKEKSNLNTYLENQEKALSIVRNFREDNTN